MNLGFPVLGIIALILATWTTNAVNAFSGGLALINVFDIPKEKKKSLSVRPAPLEPY